MTMPKFEPVAHMQVSVEVGVGTYFQRLHKQEKYNADSWRFDPLYSANQLTEAYEAGKRDAIPEGWVLVPKDSQWFLEFVREWEHFKHMGNSWLAKFYKAMLAAAPKGEEL